MITFRVENVTEPEPKIVLNKLLAGDFSYTARGTQVDADTFILKLSTGEYRVVRDDIAELRNKEAIEQEDWGYIQIYDAFPRTREIEEGDEVTVQL